MGLFASPCTSTGTTTHSHRQRRRFAALALAALLTTSALALVGCASSHPITKSGEQCASCHSDGRTAVEGTGSASATETGLTFAVESGADEVYLCTAAVAEDGTVVPSRDRTLSADELGLREILSPDGVTKARKTALEHLRQRYPGSALYRWRRVFRLMRDVRADAR